MTKQELVHTVANATGLQVKDVLQTIDATLEQIKKSVKAGDEVTLRGFGSFRKVHKAQKIVRNITTGEQMVSAAHNEPAFKVSKDFKKYVR